MWGEYESSGKGSEHGTKEHTYAMKLGCRRGLYDDTALFQKQQDG